MTIINPLPYNITNGQAVDATPVMADLNQIVNNVNSNAVASASLAASGGAGLVGYSQGASGSVLRTQAEKNQESVSVLDFGADPIGTIDSSTAYQNAINALPALGGKIVVPNGSYLLNTTPSAGTKSVFWDLSPGATFSGSGVGVGKFPYLLTNTGQEAIGPYIQCNSTQVGGSLTNGGVQVLGIEMLQPSTVTTDQSVAIYAGAQGNSSSATANIWAANFLVESSSNYGGTAQGLEIDVNASSSAGTYIGLDISGLGTSASNLNAIRFSRASGIPWTWGIWGQDFSIGILLGNGAKTANSLICAQQQGNGYDGIFLQRSTDTSPSGYFLRTVNAANNANVVLLDVQGNFDTIGIVTAAEFSATGSAIVGDLVLTNGAASQPAGQVAIGNTLSGTATAGTSGALPSQVAGYLAFFIGSTIYKLPYFNN